MSVVFVMASNMTVEQDEATQLRQTVQILAELVQQITEQLARMGGGSA